MKKEILSVTGMTCASCAKAIERGVSKSFEAIPGHGIEVVIQGKNMLLGNKKLMDDFHDKESSSG